MAIKTCSVCKQEKLESDFYKDSSKYGGLMNRCKKCDNARRVGNYKSISKRLMQPKKEIIKKLVVKKTKINTTTCILCNARGFLFRKKCLKCYISTHPTVLIQRAEFNWHREMLALEEPLEALSDLN